MDCATLPNPSDTRPMILRIKWTFHELSSKQSKLQDASIPIYQVFILFHISGLMTTPKEVFNISSVSEQVFTIGAEMKEAKRLGRALKQDS